jgi:hypothetical protein
VDVHLVRPAWYFHQATGDHGEMSIGKNGRKIKYYSRPPGAAPNGKVWHAYSGNGEWREWGALVPRITPNAAATDNALVRDGVHAQSVPYLTRDADATDRSLGMKGAYAEGWRVLVYPKAKRVNVVSPKNVRYPNLREGKAAIQEEGQVSDAPSEAVDSEASMANVPILVTPKASALVR